MDAGGAWCNDHQSGDPEAGEFDFCANTRAVEGTRGYAEIDIWRDDEAGHLVLEGYVPSKSHFTAEHALSVAKLFTDAASLVESAALPDGGTALAVPHVAMLASASEFDVRDAISRGELAAHKAVDGSARLLVAYDEGWLGPPPDAAMPD